MQQGADAALDLAPRETMWKAPTRDVLPAEASARLTPEAMGGNLEPSIAPRHRCHANDLAPAGPTIPGEVHVRRMTI